MLNFLTVVLMLLASTAFSKNVTCTKIFDAGMYLPEGDKIPDEKKPFYVNDISKKNADGSVLVFKNIGHDADSSQKPSVSQKLGKGNWTSSLTTIAKDRNGISYLQEGALGSGFTTFKFHDVSKFNPVLDFT